MEEKLEFKVGKTYLIDGTYSWSGTLQEVYVDKITETAYKLRKERSDGTWYVEWVLKENFHENKKIVEFLNTPITPPYVGTEDIKIEINNPEYLKALTTFCPICNGTGRVPDDGSTAGDKACPKCNGTGIIYAVQ